MANISVSVPLAVVLIGVVVIVTMMQTCEGSGKIAIKMQRYESSCSDNWGTQPCDTYFKLCIDAPGPWDINSCTYGYFGPSSHYENTNNMEFGTNIGGISNPIVVTRPRINFNQVMFVVESHDDEVWTSDDHLVTIGKTVTFTTGRDKASTPWKASFMERGSYRVWFFYRAYCDAHYYTSECDVFCRARDDAQGHYTCDILTGEKKCIRGWTGENCNTDIDECQLGQCHNNAPCENLPGSYSCECPNGFTGQDCNLKNSLCHSAPCQNNGTCSGDMSNYTCACHVAWSGPDCEQQVDFCENNPCQNNATCYGHVGNYTCDCPAGWDGYHCTAEVHACDSSPCQNNASCTNLPSAKYQCMCTPEYEGTACQALKNPCEPQPCLNAGNCTMLSPDVHNCTCVFGWDGANCQSYITAANQQQQGSEGSSVNWVPIVIAFVSALLIVLMLLALLFIRRRRKQKKAMENRLTAQQQSSDTVVEVAGRDNLAFRNALYDNQANARIDQASNSNGSSRSQMPVPPTPTGDDFYNYPTKPKQLPDDEELGAVGGANPYQDVDGDLDPKTAVGLTTETRQKRAAGGAGLDTRTLAGGAAGGGSGPAANDYADFGELQRRSIAARHNPGESTDSDLLNWDQAENHYSELDDVCLAIQRDADNTVHFTPSPTSTTTTTTTASPGPSQYDTIPTARHDATLSSTTSTASSSQYDVVPPARNGVTPPTTTTTAAAGSPYDVIPPGRIDITAANTSTGAGGYMSMTGGTPPPSEGPEGPEGLDSSDEEGADQEDIARLRQEVLHGSANSTVA